MISFKQILEKIEELGGIEEGSSSVQQDREYQLELISENIDVLEMKYNQKLPENYILLQKEYGSFAFERLLQIDCEYPSESSETIELVVAFNFFGLDDNDERSVIELMSLSTLEDIPDFLPVCDSLAPAFFCMSLKEEDFGQIYHYDEVDEGDEFLLVADTFDAFMMNLHINNE